MPLAVKPTFSEEEIEFLNNIGYRIQFLRKKQGLSQTELAEKAGLSAHTVFSIERKNQRGFNMVAFYRIAKALEVHPSALFDFK